MPGPTIAALWGTPPSQADKPYVPVLPLNYVAAGAAQGVEDVTDAGAAVVQGVEDTTSGMIQSVQDIATNAVGAVTRELLIAGLVVGLGIIVVNRASR